MRGSAYDWDPEAPENGEDCCDGCGEPIGDEPYGQDTEFGLVYHVECEPSD